MSEPEAAMDIAAARVEIGKVWGLDRAITKAELGRALGLSASNGGDYVSKLESGKHKLTGTIRVCVEMLIDGATPRHMSDIIKPGYPRAGAIR